MSVQSMMAKPTLAECTIHDGISFLLAPIRVKPCLLSNFKLIVGNYQAPCIAVCGLQRVSPEECTSNN